MIEIGYLHTWHHINMNSYIQNEAMDFHQSQDLNASMAVLSHTKSSISIC